MTKAYANFKFYSGNRYMIFVSIDTFSRTDSGKSWKVKPDATDHYIYNDERYTNYVSAIPFFNNFGGGAYCRAHNGYTVAGYLPYEVVTVSPAREIKKVARFTFIHRSDLEKKSGFRERDIIDRAITWQYFTDDKKHIELFTGKKEGEIKTAVFNRLTYEWVN